MAKLTVEMDLAHKRTNTLSLNKKAIGAEVVERAAHSYSAGTIFAAQLLFGRQLIARSISSVSNGCLYVCINLLVQRR